MRLLTTLAIFSLAACGASPREQYIASVNKRLAGDSAGAQNELYALAHEHPDTREGRRARATLGGSGLMTTAATVGVLSAIAIPNFLKFQGRSKQSEAKTLLKALYVYQTDYRADHQRFDRDPSRLADAVGRDAQRYAFFADVEMPFAAPPGTTPAFIEEARVRLSSLGLKPFTKTDAYLVVAIGNLDDDDVLDIWTIDESNNLVHFVDDLE